jgi:hypothetical protein
MVESGVSDALSCEKVFCGVNGEGIQVGSVDVYDRDIIMI